MIIVCPHCGILYGVDPSDLAAESRTVRCSNCDREWLHTPAAALPDNDDALRLLATSFGRDGRGSPPASPPGPHRPEVAPVSRSSRREKEEARQQRPRAVAAEPEAAPRPAPVTTLYQTLPATPKATGEPPPRGTRLSSRQLDALLNGAATDTADADASAVDALQAEPRSNEDRGWRPEPGRLSVGAQEMAKPDAAPTVEPARALNASEDETDAPPPASDNDTAEATSPPRRGPLLRRHGAAVLAAGAVAATLLVSVGLLAATRGLVLAAFPGAAGFYSAVGLAPADSLPRAWKSAASARPGRGATASRS